MGIYNLTEYVNATNELATGISKILPGEFYTFAYDYHLNPDIKKVKKDSLDYYDTLPLVYVFNLRKAKDTLYYECLNLHHLPLKTRKIWLTKLKKVAGIFMKNESPIILPSGLMKSLMIKPKYGYRQYHINRIKYLKRVPFKNIDELAKFAAPTYDASQYQDVAQRYSLYNPYTTKRKG
tara:strand:- start:10306 stop:10842 length:537 start_codon:yes stop_codon:yes gene_type:complete